MQTYHDRPSYTIKCPSLPILCQVCSASMNVTMQIRTGNRLKNMFAIHYYTYYHGSYQIATHDI